MGFPESQEKMVATAYAHCIATGRGVDRGRRE